MGLIALALPLQGVAADAMVVCMAGHGGLSTSVQVDPGASATEGMSMAVHHDMASAEAQSDSVAPDRGSLHHGGCSHCAFCGVPMAVAMTSISFQPAVMVDCFLAPMPDPAAVFLTDGPERPPKPFVA